MDYPNERYIRFYSRDTVTFSTWPWEAQALLGPLMRKLDRAGVLDTGEHDPIDAVWSLYPRWPREMIEIGLGAMLRAGTVIHEGDRILMPRFMEAQEASQTDAQRQRESRARKRDQAAVTNRDGSNGHSAGALEGETISVKPAPIEPPETVTERDGADRKRDGVSGSSSLPSHRVTPYLTNPTLTNPNQLATSPEAASPDAATSAAPSARQVAPRGAPVRFARKKRAREIFAAYETLRSDRLGGNVTRFTDDHFRAMQQTVRYIQQERGCEEPEAWDWIAKFGTAAIGEAVSPEHSPEWADKLRTWRVGPSAWTKKRYQAVMSKIDAGSKTPVNGATRKVKHDDITGTPYFMDRGSRRQCDENGRIPGEEGYGQQT